MRILNKKFLKKFLLIIVILILAINLLFLIHSQISIKVDQVDSGNSIKLATYNIYEFDLIYILPVLRDLNADILALQEVEYSKFNGTFIDATSFLAMELGMYYFNSLNSTNANPGIAILSKWPFENQNYLNLGKIDGFFERGLIAADVVSPYGNITAIVTHLQQPYYFQDRVDQVSKIINYTTNEVVNENIVVMGDFNTPDYAFDPAYNMLTKQYTDGYIAAGKSIYQGSTWPSDHPYLRVDYIFIKGATLSVLKGSGILFGTSSSSDHLGISIEISLN